MKILYQGSPGAYSHLAALEIYPDTEVIACKTFDECFTKAKEDNKLKIIIPSGIYTKIYCLFHYIFARKLFMLASFSLFRFMFAFMLTFMFM